MRARARTLELAVLGLLHEAPMHGYELRKRLNVLLGPLRALSYGSLYPCLKSMAAAGLITSSDDAPRERAEALDSGAAASARSASPARASAGSHSSSRRARIVYRLTPDGSAQLAELLCQAGPSSWEDETFDVHFALFAQTDADTRLRILEGRRTRMTERLELLRSSMSRTMDRLDEYTLELQRHGLEQVEREVRWLDDLIDNERGTRRLDGRGTHRATVQRRAPGGPTESEPAGPGALRGAGTARADGRERSADSTGTGSR